MDIIGNKTNIETLRHQLIECEESIIKQSEFDGCLVSYINEDGVCELLESRCDILNQMFKIHATNEELSRFEYVNERLFRLTQNLNERHLHLQQELSAIHGLNGEPFNLITTLNYYHDYDDPQLYAMVEDAFYGSRWNEMLCINSLYNDNSYTDSANCSNNELCNMDDGESWKEGVLNFSKFTHICICYLVHRFCVHMRYSIPDILRMTTFYYNYELNCKVDIIHIENC